MNGNKLSSSRRAALMNGGRALAVIAFAGLAARSGAAHAEGKKKKGKASKEDFFFQEEPGENGKSCSSCINFEPTEGDKGTCALVEGEVCKTCYCQGWTDKKTGKKAGT